VPKNKQVPHAKAQEEPAAEEPAPSEEAPAEEAPAEEAPAEKEEEKPAPEEEKEAKELDESGDPYADTDFEKFDQEEMSDYATEEKKALKEPLRVKDMKEMEEGIQAIAAEVSTGIDKEGSSEKEGPMMAKMSLMQQASLNKWRQAN